MKDFSDTSILVTGGNGAVGCNLVKKLVEFNANITVIDDYSQSRITNLRNLKHVKIIKGNITNERTLTKVFSKKFDYVFHLAARFANEMSLYNPLEDLKVNIEGTLKVLLHASKQKNLKRFVYTSSSSIYGSQNKKMLNEKLTPKPSTPYAASKFCGEQYCNAISELYGLDYSILRLSNSFGPFDPPGKFRNVIPNFIKSSIKNKNLIITGSGKETRDFTYVDDTINGILLAAKSKQGKNQIFNLGTGKETSVKTIAKIILELTNSKSKIVYKPLRHFDHIKRRKMDISKAKKILNYTPNTNIKRDLEKTINWF